MGIRISPGWPWPYKPNTIALRGTIRGEFGGSGEDAISEYYRGGSRIPNTGDWAAMGRSTINGKIPTVRGTQIQFSDFIGSLNYANLKWGVEASVMSKYGDGFGNNEFAMISSGVTDNPGQHCGSFRAYEAFPPNFPSTGVYSLRTLLRNLGYPRYMRVKLDNSVAVATRGDQHERKGSDRYTQVRNAGIVVYFASSWRGYWYWGGDSRRKIGTRDYHKAGRYWKQAMKITSYAFSGDDDRWGSGTLTDSSGTGGTGGGGGGSSWYGNGNSSGFSSGSGTRSPSNSDTYYDLKAEWDRGARYMYLLHTMEVNLYSCNRRPRYNIGRIGYSRIKFET